MLNQSLIVRFKGKSNARNHDIIVNSPRINTTNLISISPKLKIKSPINDLSPKAITSLKNNRNVGFNTHRHWSRPRN